MAEGESGPEIQKLTPGQEAGKPEETAKPSFEQKIKDLIEVPEGKKAAITNESLRRLAKLASQPRNQTSERLEELLRRGDDWFAEGEVPEEEWAILAGVISEKVEQLSRAASPRQTPLEEKLEKLASAIERQIMVSQQQAQELAESLRRLPSEKERERWVDVEYDQEFYTRFTPTMEPRFYTEMGTKERKLWEARWQLARAAFWKKVYSAFPEKQFENQDLQLLKNEQMEKLYNILGVQEALEWYAEVIVRGREVIKSLDPRERGKTIWDCKDETDFEKIRGIMREQALKEVVKKDENGVIVRDEKGREIKIELDALAQREADAVAWNWIWCSNLVESIDSRYSKGGRRHDLPGVLVSDDLRSTFHPQEKYEDKCRSGLEWGAFGKWGVYWIERLREMYGIDDRENIDFKAASFPREFWKAKKIGEKLIVNSPESYPRTSMKSFWEETKIEKDKRTLLRYLLNKDSIHWEQVRSDPWIGYLPIRLKKAVDFLSFYNPGQPPKEGDWVSWARSFLEPFRRLDFEKERDDAEKKKDEKKENYYHNLIVWAVYASLGGVKKPQNREPIPPLPSLEWAALTNQLRMYQVGLLKRGMGAFTGERLKIKEVKQEELR